MLVELQKSHDELEKRVDERTLELSASEKKLRDITNVLGQGVYVLDRDKKLTFLNPEGERLLGWTEEELRGKMVHDIFHFQHADGSTFPAKDCPVIKVLETGEPYQTDEDVFTRKEGRMFPVSYIATPIKEGGEVVGSVNVFQDISERKKHERELREANEKLRITFDNAPIGLALATGEGKILDVNRAFCQMLGYSRKELLAMHTADYSHPDNERINAEYRRKLLEGDIDSFQMEKRYYHKSGRMIWGSLTVSVVRDPAGKPLFFIGHIEDITQRKQMEDAFRQSEERFRALAESTSDWVWEVDENAVYTYSSPKVKEILAMSLKK